MQVIATIHTANIYRQQSLYELYQQITETKDEQKLLSLLEKGTIKSD